MQPSLPGVPVTGPAGPVGPAPLPGGEAALIGLAALVIVTIPVAVTLLALVVRDSRSGLEEFIAYLLTWLMLLSGARTALRHGAGAGDARNLAAFTHLPRHLWALIWAAGTAAALCLGGSWLVLGH